MLTYTTMETKEKKKVKKKKKLRNNEYYLTQNMFDKLYTEGLSGKKFYDLMQFILTDENILLAYRNIKRNTGSKTAGTDGKTISSLAELGPDKIIELVRKKLSNYFPGNVRRVEILKKNGKKRPLGIPTMEDRLIQQCIKQILEPICESKFYAHSYGFRPNRDATHAIGRVMSLINTTHMYYCVDIDIKGFFDNVDHGKLLKQMWTLGIRDKNLLCIISKMLKAKIDKCGIPQKGTPQGGILSPLLSNIVLNELDWWISSQWENIKTEKDYSHERYGKIDKTIKYKMLRKTSNVKEMFIVRYADDFKIFCKDYKTAYRIFHSVKMWLKERLNLEISMEKSKVTNLKKNYTEFLGFKIKATLKSKKYVAISHISDKVKKEKIKELKEAIKRVKKHPTSQEMMKLDSKILGMQNYYKHATRISIDFGEIGYKLSRFLYNQWRTISSDFIPNSKTYEKIYAGYNYKTVSICGVNLFPIAAVKFKIPLAFKQEVNNYTIEGRKLIHDKLGKANPKVIKYLLENPTKNGSVEYNDNRISLYVAQKGLCGITKEKLKIGEIETHHIIPKSMGGTDEYSNLIMVKYDVHKLIHATKKDTIEKYINRCKMDNKSLGKINVLRSKVGNYDI